MLTNSRFRLALCHHPITAGFSLDLKQLYYTLLLRKLVNFFKTKVKQLKWTTLLQIRRAYNTLKTLG